MAFMLLAEWAVVMFISPMEAFIIVIKGIALSVVKWVYSPGTASAFIVAWTLLNDRETGSREGGDKCWGLFSFNIVLSFAFFCSLSQQLFRTAALVG